jgi:hypothetical protein
MSGTPSRRVARNSAIFPDEDVEITSSYRATYGGPAGLSASSWTSRSTTSPGSTPAISRQQSLSQHNSFSATSGAVAGVNDTGVGSPISPGVSSSSLRLDMERLDLGGGEDGNRGNRGDGSNSSGHQQLEKSTSGDTLNNPDPIDPIARAEAALAAARQQLAASSSSAAKASAPLLPSLREDPSTSSLPQQEDSVASIDEAPLANTDGISPSKLPFASLDGNTQMTAAAMDAAHRVAGLVSILTTGRPSEQIQAAEKLHTILKKHGEPVQRATHLAGGTHMLFTLLQAKTKPKQPELQNACAAALAEVCKHSPALEELVALPDGPSIIIAACLRGIAAGSQVYTNLFISLVANAKDSNDGVKAACAVHKAVRVLADILAGADSGESGAENSKLNEIKNEESRKKSQKLALAALEALCLADPGPNLRKLAWGGGLASLVPLIKPPFDTTAASAMHLLLLALEQDKRHAESLCSPITLIEELSVLIADSDVDLSLQVDATKVLGAVAALRSRKADATEALNDCALPRACEILHQAEAVWSKGAPKDDKNADLHAACAALVAHLSVGSPLCCHVVLFHAEALRTVVSVLAGRHEFGLVEAVLGATANYAASPTVVL